MVEKDVLIFDTTLRDGSQGRDVSFSLEDKKKVARRLDRLGVDYIEAGWVPGNPKDTKFFQEFDRSNLEQAKLVALSSTRRPHTSPSEDKNLIALLDSRAPVVGVVGKSWRFHVDEVLDVTPNENLSMIQDSVSYLNDHGREVLYDAEHFFDGFKDDPQYALETLSTAEKAGAEVICICDTNGGTMPSEVRNITSRAREEVDATLSIHAHDDSGLAVANSISAVEEGVTVVQGTINGYGERVGNANLCTIIPNLVLKKGLACLKSESSLEELTPVSRFVSEIANKTPEKRSPYVGVNAFSHKAGLHVDAVLKHPDTFEHVSPEAVGSERKFLVSELSGGSTIERKLRNVGVDLEGSREAHKEVLENLKKLEEDGYQFENADASFAILAKRIQGELPEFFRVLEYEILTNRVDGEDPTAKASVKLSVDGDIMDAIERGHGPVDALDNAFHRCLNSFYHSIEKMRLTNYKVRILESYRGTAAVPRVMIEMTDGEKSWNTIGVSEDVIEASWEALRDGYIYGLLSQRTELSGHVG
ncbi:citramalate synthase [Candidatus Bipolaricaulota bacterium]|nr:citramalate synthase [Candidatus Bipolaricaulota bacterium]